MNDFPSMHARDAAKLPHVSLDELSARVPRASALIPVHRAKPYNPQKGPAQERGEGRRGGMDYETKKEHMREYARTRRVYMRDYKRARRAREKEKNGKI